MLKKLQWPQWGTIASSLLIVAAYPPWDFRLLAWLCLVPWLIALSHTRSLRQAIIQGIWLSVIMSILGFHWVAYVLHQFGALPWVVAAIGLFLYSLGGQPQFLVFGAVFFFFFKQWRARQEKQNATPVYLLSLTIGLALFYTGLDWTLPKLFKDTLGHAFYSASWLRQSAELGGAHLLTFCAMWLNLALFFLIDSFKAGRKLLRSPAIPSIASAFVLIALLSAFGWNRERDWKIRLQHPDSTLQSAVIQANIGDFDKVAAERGFQEAAERILADYFTLSDQALSLQQKPDLIIWPETAYASTFRKPMTTSDFSRDQRIESWVKNRRFTFLFGSYDRNSGKDYNTFFALSPFSLPLQILNASQSNGDDLLFYHKNILLMFGEYVPFQDAIPGFNQFFPQIANFGRGPGPEVLQIPVFSTTGLSASSQGSTLVTASAQTPSRVIPLSPVICYEVLFPEYVIRAANKGSRLIMNVTNDSWFGPYGEPHLHLALSIFRSIETRLPMLRATNTGFSALVTQDGEIASKTQLFRPEILNVSVPLIEPPETLMKKWGDWFGIFALISGFLTLAAALPPLKRR